MNKQIIPKFLVLSFAAFLFLSVSGLTCIDRYNICHPELKEPITLTYWRLFDDSDAFGDLLKEYHELNPRITIKYKKLAPYEQYEETIINALAEDRGPDIFAIQNTWLPRFKDKLAPIPQAKKEKDQIMTFREFQETYPDVAVQDLTIGEDVYALPLSIDTLALYYNKTLLNSAGISVPPKIWKEFQEDVEKLVKRDAKGDFLYMGAALGTANNINRAPDILSLLMIQNGTQMVDQGRFQAAFDSSSGKRALLFYTDFANPTKKVYTWNSEQHYSLDAFYEGRLAMMFNYSYHIPTIRAKAPKLNFGVAKMPQIGDESGNIVSEVNYASYFAEAVSVKSKHQKEAWKFLKWLSEPAQARRYLDKTGKPPARRDLVDAYRDKPNLGVFAEQVLTATSWFQPNNVDIDRYFSEMIEDVVAGRKSVSDAIERAATQVNLLLLELRRSQKEK